LCSPFPCQGEREIGDKAEPRFVQRLRSCDRWKSPERGGAVVFGWILSTSTNTHVLRERGSQARRAREGGLFHDEAASRETQYRGGTTCWRRRPSGYLSF
jgi:hypothetical protein